MSFFEWLLNRSGPIESFWSSLGLDILWSWLPSDIQLWIPPFIAILFAIAIKRVIAS